MKHYWYICEQGHRQLEERYPKERFESGTCKEKIGTYCGSSCHPELCGKPTKPVYTRLERVVDMLLNLLKKVGL